MRLRHGEKVQRIFRAGGAWELCPPSRKGGGASPCRTARSFGWSWTRRCRSASGPPASLTSDRNDVMIGQLEHALRAGVSGGSPGHEIAAEIVRIKSLP